jgi:ring-1,2-phenylacetyl-CoA epoxidase subunit PaaD
MVTRMGGAARVTDVDRGAADGDRAWDAVAREAVARVADPEMPFVTVGELGIVRGVEVDADDRVAVTITPTSAGCPAIEVIRREIRVRLGAAGFVSVEVRTALDPPWSSDWISAEGRRKLAAAGIAPPGAAPARPSGPVPVTLSRRRPAVPCPACGSADTVELSAFGATACKDLWRCRACAEPFEHIKEIS